ncbi:MAG: hypothetical protein J6X49_04110 [Victivallales bacterium]|nr:hypothetical protein [Victivallales bacterium]
MFKKLFIASLISSICFTSLMAQEAAAATQTADQTEKKEDKYLPLITMEQAFAKALRTRAALAQYINDESAKYQKANDTEKAEIEKNVAAAQKRFNQINTYMDVIYGLGGQRNYQYNRVTSEIYLRVGTVTEVFTRAITARNNLAKQIDQLKKDIEAEKDETKKKTLEDMQLKLAQRYALIVNALYNIFEVHPERHYNFDAATRTLYLKTNDEEITKLREQIKKIEEERKAAEEKKAAEENK